MAPDEAVGVACRPRQNVTQIKHVVCAAGAGSLWQLAKENGYVQEYENPSTEPTPPQKHAVAEERTAPSRRGSLRQLAVEKEKVFRYIDIRKEDEMGVQHEIDRRIRLESGAVIKIRDSRNPEQRRVSIAGDPTQVHIAENLVKA